MDAAKTTDVQGVRFSKATRGPVVTVPKGKAQITICLNEDVLTCFKTRVNAAGGGNYQGLMNAALREHITRKQERSK